MRGWFLLFLGVAGLTLVTNDAHDVSLVTLLINGIAHGFAVYSKGFVFLSIELVPSLQGAVQMNGINAD